MTRVSAPSLDAIREAASVLLSDGILVVPTSRWYMVCTKANNQPGIERIYRAKKRPLSKQPLFVLPERARLTDYFQLGRRARLLVDKLWPGELSLLLTWANQATAAEFLAFDETYALAHAPAGVFGQIASTVSVPLAATTVNVSNSLESDSPGPAISTDEVLLFSQKTGLVIDLVIDAGICPAFIQTTIVDCRCVDDIPRIVRQGYVHERAVRVAMSLDD